ncbi:MAG: hypothetical protein DCF20_16825 [Pseudanabaena sp.]|nr:MAG: hypothetical protein DCF20_16825 [Pseudanabaena sp.]
MAKDELGALFYGVNYGWRINFTLILATQLIELHTIATSTSDRMQLTSGSFESEPIVGFI